MIINTGGAGFIGSNLARHLEAHEEIVPFIVWSEVFTGIAGLLWLKTLTQKWPIYKGNGQNHEFFARHCRINIYWHEC